MAAVGEPKQVNLSAFQMRSRSPHRSPTSCLFDAIVRMAMRSADSDLQRAAELLWTWGRQDRDFGDAMIRLFLAAWP